MDGITNTDRLRRRYGHAVEAWLERAPALLDRLALTWGLELGAQFDDGNSGITLAATRDGVPVVLKVSPEVDVLARQTAVQRAFAATGRSPEVLEEADGAALMTRVLPGTPSTPDPAGFAALLHDLHRPADPSAYPGLSADFIDRFVPRVAPPVTLAHLDEARARTVELIATQRRTVLLHADLHRFNMIDGPPGAMVIDPKGNTGEPEFDALDYVLDGVAAEGIDARFDALVAMSDLDPDRLRRWCRALAPVVAISLPEHAEALVAHR